MSHVVGSALEFAELAHIGPEVSGDAAFRRTPTSLAMGPPRPWAVRRFAERVIVTTPFP